MQSPHSFWRDLRDEFRAVPDQLLVTNLGSTILGKHDHVAVKQLVEDFARYLYLPQLAGPEALKDTPFLMALRCSRGSQRPSHTPKATTKRPVDTEVYGEDRWSACRRRARRCW